MFARKSLVDIAQFNEPEKSDISDQSDYFAEVEPSQETTNINIHSATGQETFEVFLVKHTTVSCIFCNPQQV